MKANKNREVKNILSFHKIAYVNLIFNIKDFSTGGSKESDQNASPSLFYGQGEKRHVYV